MNDSHNRILNKTCHRRECLKFLGLNLCAAQLGCLSTRTEKNSNSSFEEDALGGPEETDSAVSVEDCTEQRMSLSLEDYPELTQVGGSCLVSFEQEFVHILVVCIGPEDWIAVWQICTHGNCNVEWADDLGLVRCPCHNSLFDIDGQVLQGPATRALSSFTVCLDEKTSTLYISKTET